MYKIAIILAICFQVCFEESKIFVLQLSIFKSSDQNILWKFNIKIYNYKFKSENETK